ncbi:MAG TPA: helix-turn-helix domain-containing protein [Thermoanaerobaculia bacterium]|nr:helix-turn-helix domain-containing protein [Thermoanaerobaculia bacterium]
MDRPIECRTLAVMREGRGLKKNQVAKALGLKPQTYYEYEKGNQVPSRNLLERAATAMGLRPHHVDRTLNYLRQTDEEARPGGGPEPGAVADLEIDRLAFALGSEWADFHRLQLQRSQRLARAVAEREMAQVHFPRLRAYPAAERPAIVRENKTFQTWAISELAAHESIEAAADDADEALAWADLAVLIAELAPGDEAFRSRSIGYAVFHRGNAIRVKGRLPEADEEFCRAKDLWKAGAAGDPEKLLDEARVLGMEASLRRAQRLLPEALGILDQAMAADRGCLRVPLLINRAKTLEEMGDYEEALTTLRRTLPLIDAEREPRLFWTVRFNSLVNLCHLSCHAAAALEVEEVKALAIKLGNGITLARVDWLQGWILAGLGHLKEAEAIFKRVRQEFLARDVPYDAGLATLELAALFMEQGRSTEVKALTQELAPVFVSQKVSREALATLLLFRDAVAQETLTLEMARHLLEDFRRARGYVSS